MFRSRSRRLGPSALVILVDSLTRLSRSRLIRRARRRPLTRMAWAPSLPSRPCRPGLRRALGAVDLGGLARSRGGSGAVFARS